MLSLASSALFAIAAITAGLVLYDCWLRLRVFFKMLKREEALLKAGFVPHSVAKETRLRRAARRRSFVLHGHPSALVRQAEARSQRALG